MANSPALHNGGKPVSPRSRAVSVSLEMSDDGNGHSTAVAAASSSSSKSGGVKRWKLKMQSLARTKADAKARLVFGVALDELLVRPTPRAMLSSGATRQLVPDVVVTLVNDLRQRAMRAEGLFRLAGSHADVAELKALLNRGMDVEFTQYNVHSVADVLKTFLRELPDPLLSHRFFPRWLSAARVDNDDLRMYYIAALLAALPAANRDLLQYLLVFLSELAEHTGANKMTPRALAVCIGPNLLMPLASQQPDNAPQMMSIQSLVVEVVQTLIETVDDLFDIDSAPVPPFKTYRALNACAPKGDGELDIAAGDIIHVFKKDDATGVWTGEIDGRVGNFHHSALRRERTVKKQQRMRKWKQRSVAHLQRVRDLDQAAAALDQLQASTSDPRQPAASEAAASADAAAAEAAAAAVSTKTLPLGFNPATAEMYLPDDEFEQLFKCTKAAYLRMPDWKREKLKSKVAI
jgi:RhoGAP domain/Villin headpiece domain/Variant SH3 domain